MEGERIDLERLGLRSGQSTAIELWLEPEPPTLAGESYPLEGGGAEARVEVSRTTGGYALRLLAEVRLQGPCARCLQPTALQLAIETREVEQRSTDDEELRSPYVIEGVLDPTAWLHDALTLAMPSKVLCRPDCRGICEICGAALNDPAEADHRHERPPDPRFAKLRELGGEGR